MKILNWLAGAVLLALASATQAHTHLKESAPANGAIMKTAPATITLTFSETATITALTLRRDSEAEQKLAPLPSEPTAQVSVPAPKVGPGMYTVNWRAMGKDGHMTSGKIQFTVATTQSSPPAASTNEGP